MPDYTTKYYFEFEARAAQARSEVARLRAEIEKLRTTTAKAPAAQPTVALPWIEQFAAAVQQAEIQYFGLRRLSYGLQSAGRDFTRYGQQIIRSMQGMATQYIEFADAATRAGIAMELPIQMQDELRDSVQATSEVLGAFDANQILETFRVWVAATGEAINTTEQMNLGIENTTEIMRLAAINNVDAAKTVEYVASAAIIYGKQMDEITDIIADFNFEAAKTQANVNDIGEALKYVGPIGAKLGIPMEELTSVLGILADHGIKASMAGRALRQMLMSLSEPTEQAKEALQDMFGPGWSRSIWDAAGNLREFNEIIDLMAAATENWSDEQRQAALGAIFTTNAITSAISLIDTQERARADNVNYIRAKTKEKAGIIDAEVLAYKALEEQIKGMPQTIESAIDKWTRSVADWVAGDAARANMLANRWKNAITDIGRVVFEEGIPHLESFAEVIRDMADFLEAHPGFIQSALGLGALSIALGTVTSKAGEFLQILTNVLLMYKLLGSAAFLTGLAAFGTTIAGIGATLMGIWAWAQAAEQMPTGWQEMPTRTRQIAALDVPTAQLEAWAAVEAFPAWAAAAQEALRIRQETEGTVDAVEDWQRELADVNVAMREHQDMLRQIRAEPLPGVLKVPIGYEAAPKFEELEEQYGPLLDAYDRYLERVEDKKKAFDKETLRLEERHQEDMAELVKSRLDRRADLIDSHEDRVKDTWRSYYRSLELAERDHQRRMLDIAEQAIEDRAELIERQAERLADTVARYELNVADAWEEYYYQEEVAAEDAAYRRQKIIDDYYEWEAEQRAQLAEDAEADQSELNDRLRRLHEDYLRDLQRAREDHLDRMWDLIARRDARGMLDELRGFAKWARRREEDYKEAVGRATEAAKERFEEEREERKRNLEEELKDFDEAEKRQQEKRKKAFERRLYLMERAHKRELAEIAERNKEEIEELEDTIRERRQIEKDAYRQRLDDMEEAHQYQLNEMRRDHQEILDEYDDETRDLVEALEEQQRKLMAKRKALHEEELEEMDKLNKESLQAQYDALRFTETDLRNIFFERWTNLAKYMGWELQQIEDYYVASLKELLAGAWLTGDYYKYRAGITGATGGAMAGGAVGGAVLGGAPVAPAMSRYTAIPTGGGTTTTGGGAAVTGAITGTLGGVTGAARTYSLTSPDPWERAMASLQQRGIDTEVTTGTRTGGYIEEAGYVAGATTSGGVVPYEATYRAAAAGKDLGGYGWTLLAAQGKYESGFDPNAVSSAGAQGIAQFMPGTWPTWGGTGDPFDPADAIPAQAAFMEWLVDYMRSKGRSPAVNWALLGYLHGAAGALRRTTLQEFPSASRGYMSGILHTASEWKSKYGLASGGIVRHPGMYWLAEKGPELVLPTDLTQFIMNRRGQAGRAAGASLVLQQNFTFRGTFTEGDKRWFLKASENMAYAAFEKVIKEAQRGR